MAYGDRATYIDVDADIKDLQKMLDCSGGKMAVPVIVEGERVTSASGESPGSASPERSSGPSWTG